MPRAIKNSFLSLVVLAAAITLVAASPAAAANNTVPVTLKITKVACVEDCDEDGLESTLESTADFYAKAALDGQNIWTSPRAPNDRSSYEPANWIHTWEFGNGTAAIPKTVRIGIEIYDHDSTSPDDKADVSATDGVDTFHVDVNLADASYEGSNCTQGDGGPNDEPSVFVCFEIDTGDKDQDGLLDRWETDGIDMNNQPGPELTLAGANPNKRDVYVELDYMDGHKPDANAIADVVNAFAAQDVNLHVEQDEQIPHANDITTFAGFDSTKAMRFGTAGERGNPQTVAAKRLAYHYSLWAHTRDGGGSSGRGELRGNDFIVTLGGGSWGMDGSGHNVGTRLQQAGTFMHELGHNLGLDHGGGDDKNCKPNYISIMNYTFQTRGIPQDGGGERLDYSTSARPAFVSKLDETALSEGLGVKTLGTSNDLTIWASDADTTVRRGRADQPLDWNGKNGIESGNVVSDINNLSKLTTDTVGECTASAGETNLTGFNDWNNLDLNFRDDGSAGDGAHTPTPRELTDTEAVAIEKLWFDPVSIGDANRTEGDSGTETMTFTVKLPAGAARRFTVDYATADGSAKAGEDYIATSGKLTFEPGQQTATIEVPIKGDTAPEPDETFVVRLANPQGATIDDGEATGTIKTDPEPVAAIKGATIEEESAKLDFTVSLSEANNTPVKVDYATANGTASAPQDYDAASGTIEFAVGETTKTVPVQINEDALDELDETFTVMLSNVRNANLDPGKDSAAGTIVDDDRDGAFSCRASALAIGSSEPAVANGPNQPCRDDARVARQVKIGATTANLLSASTDQTPDDLASTKPRIGDKASGHAEATNILISSGLNVALVQSMVSDAKAECRGGALPEMTGKSRVALLSINGQPALTIDGRVNIPLGLAVLRLNQTTTTRNGVVQRAVVLDNLIGPDIVIGEVKAGFTGTDAHPGGSPCTA